MSPISNSPCKRVVLASAGGGGDGGGGSGGSPRGGERERERARSGGELMAGGQPGAKQTEALGATQTHKTKTHKLSIDACGFGCAMSIVKSRYERRMINGMPTYD